MSRIRPPFTTSITGPRTVPLRSLTRLDRPPGSLVLRPLLGQDKPPFLVLLLQDKGFDLVAHLDHFVGVDVVADRQFPGRDHALRLETDVEQDLVLVDFDHGAGDDVAIVELDDRPSYRIFEGGAAEVVGNNLARCVSTGLVESAHLSRRGFVPLLRWRRLWSTG